MEGDISHDERILLSNIFNSENEFIKLNDLNGNKGSLRALENLIFLDLVEIENENQIYLTTEGYYFCERIFKIKYFENNNYNRNFYNKKASIIIYLVFILLFGFVIFTFKKWKTENIRSVEEIISLETIINVNEIDSIKSELKRINDSIKSIKNN